MRFPQCLGLLALTIAAGACGSNSTGPGPVTPPDVLITGMLEIPSTYEVDLETGTLQTDASVDLWDRATDATDVQFAVEHGARLVLMGATEPDYAACARAAFSDAPVQLIGIVAPQYFCVTTNEGRISRVKLLNAPIENDYNLHIEFTTWKKAS